MIPINKYQDLEPFAGMIVALKINDQNKGHFSTLYSFEDSPEIKFGILAGKVSVDEGKRDKASRTGYKIEYFLKPSQWFLNPHLNKTTLETYSFEARIATLEEINRLKGAIDSKKAHHPYLQEGAMPRVDWDKLKILSKKHFSNQATLLLCGLQDETSEVHRFPKEIVVKILTYF